MLELQKVLVPIDFSRGSLKAVEYAVSLVSKFDAELQLLHVLEIPAGLSADAEIQTEPGKHISVLSYLEDSALEKLQKLETKLSSKYGIRATHTLVDGPPHEVILATAEKEGVDQIVMGTHGRTGIKHLFLGSIAERVVRRSLCPVTTVREEEPDVQSKEVHHLLAELDG